MAKKPVRADRREAIRLFTVASLAIVIVACVIIGVLNWRTLQEWKISSAADGEVNSVQAKSKKLNSNLMIDQVIKLIAPAQPRIKNSGVAFTQGFDGKPKSATRVTINLQRRDNGARLQAALGDPDIDMKSEWATSDFPDGPMYDRLIEYHSDDGITLRIHMNRESVSGVEMDFPEVGSATAHLEVLNTAPDFDSTQ